MGNGHSSSHPLALSPPGDHEALPGAGVHPEELHIPHIGLLFPKYLEIIDSKVLRGYQEQISRGLLAPF